MRICFECKKEIKLSEPYELLGCDGDFIHVTCKEAWNRKIDRINSMSDKEFIGWMLGEDQE